MVGSAPCRLEAPDAALPQDGSRILGDGRVRRDDGQPIQDRLGDKAAIKRIPVVGGQQRIVDGDLLIERKSLYLEPLSPAGHVSVWRLGQGQATQAVFDGYLPC